jgi:CBS domain-containing protein
MGVKVKDVMTRDVDVARPEEPVREVAARMAKGDFGAMPVVDGEKLVGMVTDRDLAIRVLAAGKDPSTPVGDVITRDVTFVRGSENVDDILDKMADARIRRLPVVNKMDELIGVVSLGDLCGEVSAKHFGSALRIICEPQGAASFRPIDGSVFTG